ncbi:unnamed protein product [Amoebophrya sp. A25]|nr:unnamed protein product [Amoebophrya sp. A25]|eukprot:GSA25T00009139001.1
MLLRRTGYLLTRSKMSVTGVWFRKGLRLHDNLPLLAACEEEQKRGGSIVPFFVLDTQTLDPRVGPHRYAFILECLSDLDAQLRQKYNSRLLVFKGKPDEVVAALMTPPGAKRTSSSGAKTGRRELLPKEVGNLCLQRVFYEYDSEPKFAEFDAVLKPCAEANDVQYKSYPGHTILDLEKAKPAVLEGKGGGVYGKRPYDMKMIQEFMRVQLGSKSVDSLDVPQPKPAPTKIPGLPKGVPMKGGDLDVPPVQKLFPKHEFSKIREKEFPGGEREALKRLAACCKDVDYISKFEKPKTSSTNGGRAGSSPGVDKWHQPATTGLSAYMKFGALSVRQFWHAVNDCYAKRKGQHAKPPMSLHGQLYFREMFYVLSVTVPNWDQASGNMMCKDIAWDAKDSKKLKAWEEGKTGYPYIDALMRQLRSTGWMHHLGRHAVSCFLTRGDLYQHWMHGRDVFDYYLIDADWALNNGNWLWLAGVAPFSMPFFRVYHPAPGKDSALNAEPTGDFIRYWVPELKNFPSKFIHRPWEAPQLAQVQAKCVIGKDYPKPIVEHKQAQERNLSAFKKSSDSLKSGGSSLKRPASGGSPGAAKKMKK